jgi:HlyD family secretion protein
MSLVRLVPRESDPARGVLEAQLHAARLRLELVERGGESQDLLLTRRFDERDRLSAEADAAGAALDAAQARYDFARRELTRQTELRASGHFSDREVSEAERAAAVALADVNQATTDLNGASERWRRLLTLTPAGSRGDDLHELELASLKEGVREAEGRLRDFDFRAGARTLSAPFAGRVDRVFVQGGSACEPGEPLDSLYDPDSLYALAYVPAEQVDGFPPKSNVRIFPRGAPTPIPGVVTTVYSAWGAVPTALQSTFGDQRSAVTVRIDLGPSERHKLAPAMLLNIVAAAR